MLSTNVLFTAVRPLVRAWRLWRWSKAHEPLLSVLDPDWVRAMHLSAGLAVRNPLDQEPWVLDLVEVSRPDVELMVSLTAVQGVVRVALDWPVEIYTAAAADLEASLMLDEHHRLHDLDDRRNP
jgi:hypothetical protein